MALDWQGGPLSPDWQRAPLNLQCVKDARPVFCWQDQQPQTPLPSTKCERGGHPDAIPTVKRNYAVAHGLQVLYTGVTQADPAETRCVVQVVEIPRCRLSLALLLSRWLVSVNWHLCNAHHHCGQSAKYSSHHFHGGVSL